MTDYTPFYTSEGAVMLHIRNVSLNKNLSESKVQVQLQKYNLPPYDQRIFIVDFNDNQKVVASIPLIKDINLKQKKPNQIDLEHKNYWFILFFDDPQSASDFVSHTKLSDPKVKMGMRSSSSDAIPIPSSKKEDNNAENNSNNNGNHTNIDANQSFKSSSPSSTWDNARRMPDRSKLSKSFNIVENKSNSPIRIGRLPPGNHRGTASSSSPENNSPIAPNSPSSNPDLSQKRSSGSEISNESLNAMLCDNIDDTSICEFKSEPNDHILSPPLLSPTSSKCELDDEDVIFSKYDRRPSFLELEILKAKKRSQSNSSNRHCKKIVISPRHLLSTRLLQLLIENSAAYFQDVEFPEAFVKTIIPDYLENWISYLIEENAFTLEFFSCLTLEYEHILNLHRLIPILLSNGLDINVREINDPDIIAELLKFYFTEMRAPIITFEFFDPLSSFDEVNGDPDKEKEWIHKLLKSQPPQNLTILKFFMKYICLIYSNSPSNHLNLLQISSIFAPALILPKDLLYKKLSPVPLTKQLVF